MSRGDWRLARAQATGLAHNSLRRNGPEVAFACRPGLPFSALPAHFAWNLARWIRRWSRLRSTIRAV